MISIEFTWSIKIFPLSYQKKNSSVNLTLEVHNSLFVCVCVWPNEFN